MTAERRNGSSEAPSLRRNLLMCSITLYDETIPGLTFAASASKPGPERMKAAGKGRDYDCIIGGSGGVESTIVAVSVAELGLRPLAHLDNGWSIDLAVTNSNGGQLNIDLITDSSSGGRFATCSAHGSWLNIAEIEISALRRTTLPDRGESVDEFRKLYGKRAHHHQLALHY